MSQEINSGLGNSKIKMKNQKATDIINIMWKVWVSLDEEIQSRPATNERKEEAHSIGNTLINLMTRVRALVDE